MAICTICKSVVQRTKAEVQCDKCKQIYHDTCTGLKSSDFELVRTGKLAWKCGGCTGKAKENTTEDQFQELLKIVSSIKEEQKSLIIAVNSNGDFLSAQQNTIAELSGKIENLVNRLENSERENNSLKLKVSELERRVNHLDQDRRRNIAEINGIPFKKGESPDTLVIQVGRAIGMEIRPEDIDYCHRQRPKPSTEDNPRPPGIVVKFVRQHFKDELIRLKRVKRDLTTRHLGWDDSTAYSVYVNESLTAYNRHLYHMARKLKIEKKVEFLWVNKGRILIRKEKGSQVHVISEPGDLKRYDS